MSKRLVLAVLFLAAGIPMLPAATAPLGIAAITLGSVLLVLPRMGPRTAA